MLTHSEKQPNKTIPSPSKWSAPARIRRMVGGGSINEFDALVAEYGDFIDLCLPGKPLYLVNDADLAHAIIVEQHQNFIKSKNYQELARILGQGLVTSDGELWRRQRKLAQPAFHRARIAGFAQMMVKDTEAMLLRWQDFTPEKIIDLSHEMNALTFEIVGHTLFSTDTQAFAEQIREAMHFAIDFVNRRVINPFRLPIWMPRRKNRKFVLMLQILNDFVDGVISQRRKNTQVKNDLLGLLMQARDEETGTGMSDRQLRDEVMTFVLAGHETTSNSLSWTLFALDKNPEIRNKLEDEIDTVLNGKVPDFENINRLIYTRMVVEESMRLYPAAWLIERENTVDIDLAGHRIKKGAVFMIYTYGIHRNARYWHDPLVFDPQRFAPDNSVPYKREAYLPFSYGPRQCIGSQFAMVEATLILAMIVQKFRWNISAEHPVEPEPSVTLRPRYGLKASLTKRRG